MPRRRAVFYFNKQNHAAVFDNQVDFAVGAVPVAGKQRAALGLEEGKCGIFPCRTLFVV